MSVEFPFIEEIYDLEAAELESTLERVQDALADETQAVPKGFDDYEEFLEDGEAL